jgi:hypothetical protein
MAIYTRFGTRVEFVSAEEVSVLIERTRDAVTRWHYPEKLPKKRNKTSEYEEVPVWHAVAKDAETGRLIIDGGQIPGNEFKADDGWREIVAAMRAAPKG